MLSSDREILIQTGREVHRLGVRLDSVDLRLERLEGFGREG